MGSTFRMEQFDLSRLSREFLATVIHSAGCIRDYGAVKVVPAGSTTILLIDETALDKTDSVLRHEVDVREAESVIVLRSGFNIDIALRELRAGNYRRVAGSELPEYLERLRKDRGGLPRASGKQGKSVVGPHGPDRLKQGPSLSTQPSPSDSPAQTQTTHMGPVFASPTMQRIDADLSRIARFQFDVLICGETGTGKDVAAYEVHRRSERNGQPFLTVPLASLCPSLVESEMFGHVRGAYSGATDAKLGKFEAAQGGTVYLPEVSNLTEDMQLKLLYFMQYKRCLRVGEDPRHPERRCDVRLIMATNENLEECVRSGRMREDFYYRIKGISITMPPLRERREAIPSLVNHFLRIHSSGIDNPPMFSSEAMDWMMKQNWPGNVRELENLVRATLTTESTPLIGLPDILAHTGMTRCACQPLNMLAHENGQLMEYREFTEKMQSLYIEQCLSRTGGDVSKAARLSGLTPHGFRKAIDRLGLSR